MWGGDLDTQAFPASGADVDGAEFAALDILQHGLAGDAEGAGGVGGRATQPSGASSTNRSRSSSVRRIRQGAPGVICSPATKPSLSQRSRVEGAMPSCLAAAVTLSSSPSGGVVAGLVAGDLPVVPQRLDPYWR